jgi:hypothetical protein
VEPSLEIGMVRGDGDGLAAALAALRSATREHAQSRDTTAMRHSVQELARLARERGLRAEEAIVELKHLWASVPEVAGVPVIDRRALLDELVTLCIDEYYRAPNARH